MKFWKPLNVIIYIIIIYSSVARGGAMGHLHPKPRLLCTRYNGVLAFHTQNFNINVAFKPKLSDCTPQAKFLATPQIIYKIFIRNKCPKEHDIFWKLKIIANQENCVVKCVITNLNNPLKPASGWRKKHMRPLDFLWRRRSVKKNMENGSLSPSWDNVCRELETIFELF